MSMTVAVTRNVSRKIRGFLASSMLEIAPGVYSAPRLSQAVRTRIWDVLVDWFPGESDASIVIVWSDASMPGGQNVKTLGIPSIRFVEIDGLIVSHRP